MRRDERYRLEVEQAIESGQIFPIGGICGAVKRAGGSCDLPAGQGTGHLGTGLCINHGGTSRRERVKGAWILAHEIARALNVSPWEALLGEVRRTAGMVAWLDRKVAEAVDDNDLLERDVEQGGYARWVEMRADERRHLARVSKMALDAGVAKELVARFTMHGEVVGQLVLRVLGSLQLNDDQLALARDTLRSELIGLEATLNEDRVIEGESVEVRR